MNYLKGLEYVGKLFTALFGAGFVLFVIEDDVEIAWPCFCLSIFGLTLWVFTIGANKKKKG